MFASSRSRLGRGDATGVRRRAGFHARRQAPVPPSAPPQPPVVAPEDPEEEPEDEEEGNVTSDDESGVGSSDSEGEDSDDEHEPPKNPGEVGVGRHSPFNNLDQAPTLSGFSIETVSATSTSSSTTTTATTTSAPAGTIVGNNPGSPANPTTTNAVTTTESGSTTASNPGQGAPLFLPTTLITSSMRDQELPAATSYPANDLSAGIPDEPVPTSRGLQPGAKAGIAVGSIAGAGLLISILLVLWKRFYIRRNRASTVSSVPPGPPPPDTRTDSQILDDLMKQAYVHQNGGYAVSDEKRETLDPATIPNAEIRGSIASWIRRHHPLKLNPMADKRSLRSTSSLGSRSPTSVASVPTTPRAPSWLNRPPSGRFLTPPRIGGQRFVSVWSDTSVGTEATGVTGVSGVTSEGDNSILDMYGDKRDTRGTVMSDGPQFSVKRASSPVLGTKM